MNKKVFIKNHNLEEQKEFLRAQGCCDTVGTFELSGGSVAVIKEMEINDNQDRQ